MVEIGIEMRGKDSLIDKNRKCHSKDKGVTFPLQIFLALSSS